MREDNKIGVDLFVKFNIIFILYKSKSLYNLVVIILDYLHLLTI
jgi:hypothetical protein